MPEVLRAGPIGLEGIDADLVRFMRKKGLHPDDVALLPGGGGWLLIEMGGETPDEAEGRARALMGRLAAEKNAPETRLLTDVSQQKRVWAIREAGLAATAHVPGEKAAWPGWEDSAVAPEKLGAYLRDLRVLMDRFEYRCALYGHFGQGCVHTRIDFDLLTAAGVAKFRRFVEEAAGLVVRYGGSLSGEHGDGQSRGELLARMYGEELVEAFRKMKDLWDPDQKMNPGKVVEPYRLDENLRLGVKYRPPPAQTHFAFEDDQGSFARATLRCVGVGKCRRLDGGTMCPSFMVTREEEHSTRGRARLLFEMMKGESVKGGWKDEHVKESLDLCLSCKGCKSDCPVGVDMATYKAEVLSHYYEGRLRPMAARSMGQIRRWARLASHAPWLANFFGRAAGISRVTKALAGIAGEREVPRFAEQTFQSWFFGRPARFAHGPPVVLWADTFNDHFTPEIAEAAVEVLEAAGFVVSVPHGDLCCGRPLYDFGMLKQAKERLQEVLFALRPVLEMGTPIVVLEPSCAAVFRDELVGLFPHDEDAKRLRGQVKLLSELLAGEEGRGFELPRVVKKAIVQEHCHHKAVMGTEAQGKVMSRLGLDFDVLDAGCCGMAGSFGFERGEHYEVSLKCGERRLLPAVREAAVETLVLADGFSCREQIWQGTGRRALHLAEVIQLGMRGRRGEE
ncbi:MAG: FAD-linked oxidase C-terminal domain-containing protein [Polyangiaceae bacterium]